VDKLLYGWELMKKVCDCDLEMSMGITPEKVKTILNKGFEELEKGTIGYGLFTDIKELSKYRLSIFTLCLLP